jgi:DNA modification methylase
VVIAGHGRLEAAQRLGMTTAPCIVLPGLTEVQKRALMLADNKIAQNAGWDHEKLFAEIVELVQLSEFDITITGFEAPEVDRILCDGEEQPGDPLDELPDAPPSVVSKAGDLWLLGGHRLMCGDARSGADADLLRGSAEIAMAFMDPPYNVKVADIVGRGATKHQEFAMASGEMSPGEFLDFVRQTLGNAARISREGAVHFVCMDWRHIRTLIEAGEPIYGAMLNLVVWAKTNAGQGSFYRSQHELIAVFRCGDGPHLNNVELGRHGRSRSNVWEYAGVNSFGKGRLDDLQAHPTVKPVAMICDAIKDCTRRGDYVLDLFGGSGSTLLAAERVGRRALLLEYEPRFVDLSIRRWQAFTGKDAVHGATGQVFDDLAASLQEVAS